VANSADVEERPWILRFLRGLTLKRAILGIAAVTMVVTLGSALVMRVVEHKTYTSFGEACWWAIQTVTTTGYGDNPPVTVGGRIVGTVVMLFGTALIPAITSLVTAVFLNQQIRARGDQPRI
jgi:voltage-gated potassium channel